MKAQGVRLGRAEFEAPVRNPDGALEKQLAVGLWASKMISGLEMQSSIIQDAELSKHDDRALLLSSVELCK